MGWHFLPQAGLGLPGLVSGLVMQFCGLGPVRAAKFWPIPGQFFAFLSCGLVGGVTKNLAQVRLSH